MEPILTVPEVARYLKISRAKAYALIQKGEIPHLRIGRNVRVRESDLQKWLTDLFFDGTLIDYEQGAALAKEAVKRLQR